MKDEIEWNGAIAPRENPVEFPLADEDPEWSEIGRDRGNRFLLWYIIGFFILVLLYLAFLMHGANASQMQASTYWEDSYVSDGRRFDPNGITAAHKILPLGTKLTVGYKPSRRVIVLVIEDRGPFIPGRELDLSRGAAKALRFPGLGRVDVQFWPPLPKPRPQP
jgi:rare lipoprotein A